MANLIDYIKWRGDLTFLERPFCEVDSVVCSMLAYEDFRGIVPALKEEGHRSVAQAVKEYKHLHGEKQLPAILDAAANSDRFGTLLLSDYVDILDSTNENTQFAAIHIFGEGIEYIAFRGTDNSIVGWREDFSMSFEIVRAQQYASDYLNRMINENDLNVMVGGHSKGGNLAIYSAAMLGTEKLEKIEKIYSFDGPGLCPDIISSEVYQTIKDKIIRVIPDFSMIGTLFEQEPADYIVQSSVDGVMEHDAYTWQIQGADFVRAEDLKEKCKNYHRIFREWIEEVELEKRRIFTKDFFDALDKQGENTMNELLAGGFERFENVLFTLGESRKESKIVLGKLIGSFIRGIERIDFLELLHTKKILQGIGMVLFGIIFICFQEIAARLVGTICFIGFLLYSCYRLFRFYQDYNNKRSVNKYKVILYAGIAVIEIFCIMKNNIILISVNLLIGLFFLWHAKDGMKKMILLKHCRKKRWVLYLLDCILTGIFGIVALAISNMGSGLYMLVAGNYLVVAGFIGTIKAMSQEIK